MGKFGLWKHMPEICLWYAKYISNMCPIHQPNIIKNQKVCTIMSNICQYMPEYANDIPKIRSRYAQDMPKIYQKFAQFMFKVWLRLAKYMPNSNIRPRYAKNMPKIFPWYAKDMPRCGKICTKYAQNIFKILLKSAKSIPHVCTIYGREISPGMSKISQENAENMLQIISHPSCLWKYWVL